MPFPNRGEEPSFEDANNNGYPDNFEAEEETLKQQIAQRRKMYGLSGDESSTKPKRKRYYSPADPDLERLFGNRSSNLNRDDGLSDPMETKYSAFSELFGDSVNYDSGKPIPKKPKQPYWNNRRRRS